jgi:hypothetical protein
LSIEQFIREEIKTVDNLRAVLLLRSFPLLEWDTITVSGKLYLPPDSATQVLANLAARGLLVTNGAPPRYRYQPQTAELENMMEQLARFDREQPVTLINLIYARPEEVQAFADAFRLRKSGS